LVIAAKPLRHELANLLRREIGHLDVGVAGEAVIIGREAAGDQPLAQVILSGEGLDAGHQPGALIVGHVDLIQPVEEEDGLARFQQSVEVSRTVGKVADLELLNDVVEDTQPAVGQLLQADKDRHAVEITAHAPHGDVLEKGCLARAWLAQYEQVLALPHEFQTVAPVLLMPATEVAVALTGELSLHLL